MWATISTSPERASVTTAVINPSAPNFGAKVRPSSISCADADKKFPPLLEHVCFKLNHKRALSFCFDAFSSREPVSTSLENAISPYLEVRAHGSAQSAAP